MFSSKGHFHQQKRNRREAHFLWKTRFHVQMMRIWSPKAANLVPAQELNVKSFGMQEREERQLEILQNNVLSQMQLCKYKESLISNPFIFSSFSTFLIIFFLIWDYMYSKWLYLVLAHSFCLSGRTLLSVIWMFCRLTIQPRDASIYKYNSTIMCSLFLVKEPANLKIQLVLNYLNALHRSHDGFPWA